MAVGQKILDGRYEILSVLGEGGMGRAFLAQDHKYEAPVVIKAMHQRFISDLRFHDLFVREMEFLSQFQHPHVVSLLKTGVDPTIGPFLVMEYLDGRPLGDILDETPVFQPRRVGKLLVQLCKALQAAHNRGIIHRDIKPNNMMIIYPGSSSERLKVLDFGLAKLDAAPHINVDDLKGHRNRIRAVGTPEYMNPEQMRGNEVDHRADFYSVGVMIYEMLTGRRPFDHPKEQELMNLHMKATPPSFREAGLPENAIKPGVEQVVMSCLSKYPMDRPRDARELAVRYMAALGEKLDTTSFEEPVTTKTQSKTPSALEFVLHNQKDAVQLEAWMPESIAIIKLRSFLMEFYGEVVESVPGLVKSKLWMGGPPQPPPAPSLMQRLKLAKAPEPPPQPPQAQLDLYMQKKDSSDNKLHITVVIHKPEPCPPWLHAKWKTYTEGVINGLCSHLIATKLK
jgi:eukaryotic-like serine/threonine-protein kinase